MSVVHRRVYFMGLHQSRSVFSRVMDTEINITDPAHNNVHFGSFKRAEAKHLWKIN